MSEPAALTDLDETGVFTITMNRPERRNAMNSAAFRAVGEALLEANSNPAVATVLLTGAGGDFSSGLDLTAPPSAADGDQPFEILMDAICNLEKPLVAAVRGCAIGFGMTVLFHCDVVYVAESARLRMPFANLGLVTEAASCYLAPLAIGQKQAAELLYTADWVDAQGALEYGIATRIYPDDSILEEAKAKARQMAQWPVTSLVEMKRLLKSFHKDNIAKARAAEAEAMAKLFGGPENREAIKAFIEKRTPDFQQFRS
ncbi:MAG: enoyl-CoA hydratase/isomerase family protein [Deltaproteobacteria bacterium]|nr:enoyl-CoA hydratase/isomerase family protein [Deltaproteobacteria bacterium]